MLAFKGLKRCDPFHIVFDPIGQFENVRSEERRVG